MRAKDFKLNKTYIFSDIEYFVNNNDDFELIEYGENIIGLNFVVLKNVGTNDCISFVLTFVNLQYFYKCIYSDFL